MHVGVRLRELDNRIPIYFPFPHEEHSAETIILYMAFTYPIHRFPLLLKSAQLHHSSSFLLTNLAHLHKLLLQISFNFQAMLHIGYLLLESTLWYLQNSLSRYMKQFSTTHANCKDKANSRT
jgi:hypothetical protein